MRSERARHNKIIFSGTVGAGKSTAIAALSDIPPVATEAVASDETGLIKKTTTVAMDYGVLNLPGGEKVMLYGTPIAAVALTMILGALIFSLIGYDGVGAVREIFLTPLTNVFDALAKVRPWRRRILPALVI